VTNKNSVAKFLLVKRFKTAALYAPDIMAILPKLTNSLKNKKLLEILRIFLAKSIECVIK
jgi:hypothetical protein